MHAGDAFTQLRPRFAEESTHVLSASCSKNSSKNSSQTAGKKGRSKAGAEPRARSSSSWVDGGRRIDLARASAAGLFPHAAPHPSELERDARTETWSVHDGAAFARSVRTQTPRAPNERRALAAFYGVDIRELKARAAFFGVDEATLRPKKEPKWQRRQEYVKWQPASKKRAAAAAAAAAAASSPGSVADERAPLAGEDAQVCATTNATAATQPPTQDYTRPRHHHTHNHGWA